MAKTQKDEQEAKVITGEEMVEVHLFKDNERYKDDVFVAVNGRSYKIQRGIRVKVPQCVAEVLERSMRQDEATARMMDEESAKFEAAAEKLGI